MRVRSRLGVLVSILATAGPAAAAELPRPRPVPSSPWSKVYYAYADAILQHGRDTHGPEKTGLILSALDRSTLALLDDRPPAPAGLRQAARAGAADGPLVGASPLHDQNLLRLLYTLGEIRPIYREAADAQLKWLLRQPDRADGGAPWDGGLAWNVLTDESIRLSPDAGPHRPWMLWDRCFDLDPEAAKRLALSLRAAATKDLKDARRAGFAIRTFSVAYQRTGDEAFLKAIDSVLTPLEEFRAADVPPVQRLSLAIDCGGAVPRVPATLAPRLRIMTAHHDAGFCGLPHDVKGKGFHAIDRAAATPLWVAGDDGYTTAKVGMLCVSRYENTGDTRYRALVHAAADAYRDPAPPPEPDTWPATFGHAISLQLAAWRSTADAAYLERAKALADLSTRTFWPDGVPLPRASAKSQHYESATGADTLALALLELNLGVLHVTAVRCPPNTIDR